jgi:uncharacterized protein
LAELNPQEAEQAALQLLRLGVLKPSGEAEITTPSGHPDRLTIWLHITDACNLRCAYCYLPHRPEEMSLDTGMRSIASAFDTAARRGWHKVQIKYAGGEPVLRSDVVFELHEYARRLASDRGFELDGVVLSNGTLLSPAIMEQLARAGLRLMISLDGLGVDHDRQRSSAGARSTAHTVKEAIQQAAAAELKLSVTITVTDQNAASLAETVAWIDQFGAAFNLNFFRDTPRAVEADKLALKDDRIVVGIQRAFAWLEDHPSRRSLLGIIDRANFAIPHTHTCGVGANYIVFRPDGQAAACHMLLDQPVSSLEFPDPLAAIQNSLGAQLNQPVALKAGCGECAWRFGCTGGCPLVTKKASGRFDGQSPYCGIYQALFPSLLRLEGLRVLKEQPGLLDPGNSS